MCTCIINYIYIYINMNLNMYMNTTQYVKTNQTGAANSSASAEAWTRNHVQHRRIWRPGDGGKPQENHGFSPQHGWFIPMEHPMKHGKIEGGSPMTKRKPPYSQTHRRFLPKRTNKK